MTVTRESVRAEVEIDAPIEEVWQILTDVDGYAEWNPFTPDVKTTLELGTPVEMQVRLVGNFLITRTESITRNAPFALGWDMQMGTPSILYAERVQQLTTIEGGRTRYISEDTFSGWLRPLVLGLFGRAMERGFTDCGLGLKKEAERRAAPTRGELTTPMQGVQRKEEDERGDSSRANPDREVLGRVL